MSRDTSDVERWINTNVEALDLIEVEGYAAVQPRDISPLTEEQKRKYLDSLPDISDTFEGYWDDDD